MIGYHLLVDGLTRSDVNKYKVECILRDIPSIINMKILSGPHIVKGVPENPGWTGFEIIDKSHISIHTFSDTRVVSIDIYSCKKFDAKKVMKYLQSNLDYLKFNGRFIERDILDEKIFHI